MHDASSQIEVKASYDLPFQWFNLVFQTGCDWLLLFACWFLDFTICQLIIGQNIQLLAFPTHWAAIWAPPARIYKPSIRALFSLYIWIIWFNILSLVACPFLIPVQGPLPESTGLFCCSGPYAFHLCQFCVLNNDWKNKSFVLHSFNTTEVHLT